jgi:hypothetical protein
LASAAGPTNSGSISIDRHEETQAPHWMHAIDCVTSTMFSCGTMYSRSGDRLLVDEPWRDALDLLPVHRVHVDDQVLDHRHVVHRLDLDDAVLRAGRRLVEVRCGTPGPTGR